MIRLTDASKVGICFLIFTLLVGCNVFSVVDKPSGDAQLLDAARVCLDKGDYECASKNYNALSASSADEANSELAFLQMAQAGVNVGIFMTAVVKNSSSAGKIVTQIANSIGSNANETTRLALFHAYQNYKNVTDTRVQGLIQFVTSLVLMAELLAEDAATPGNLKKSDLVADPEGCLTASLLTFTTCNKPSGHKLQTGTVSFTLKNAVDSDLSGDPSLSMINAAVNAVSAGLDQMQTSGSLGSTSLTFSSGLLSKANEGIIVGTDSPIYRRALIEYDVGAN